MVCLWALAGILLYAAIGRRCRKESVYWQLICRVLQLVRCLTRWTFAGSYSAVCNGRPGKKTSVPLLRVRDMWRNSLLLINMAETRLPYVMNSSYSIGKRWMTEMRKIIKWPQGLLAPELWEVVLLLSDLTPGVGRRNIGRAVRKQTKVNLLMIKEVLSMNLTLPAMLLWTLAVSEKVECSRERESSKGSQSHLKARTLDLGYWIRVRGKCA